MEEEDGPAIDRERSPIDPNRGRLPPNIFLHYNSNSESETDESHETESNSSEDEVQAPGQGRTWTPSTNPSAKTNGA